LDFPTSRSAKAELPTVLHRITACYKIQVNLILHLFVNIALQGKMKDSLE